MWLEKWLPIFFGCHCRPDRSFFYRGHKFPICARCTGELAGMLILVLTWAFVHPGALATLPLLLPLIADGTLQALTAYESRNYRRFWTGLIFGYGLANLIFLSFAAVFNWGFETGLRLFG